MNHRIAGLHHVTAIASSAKQNFEFYSKLLGLRLVKKTINPDYPRAYHLYYGNEAGDPGTIFSVLPWENIGPGYAGTGMITDISFSVPEGSLEFWKRRLNGYKARYGEKNERFGEEFVSCIDPDGLPFNLIVSDRQDTRQGWQGHEVSGAMAVKGLHGITLMVKNIEQTSHILIDVFGYSLADRQGNKSRFITDAAAGANIIDLVEEPGGPAGYVAGGAVHYAAFRVNGDEAMSFFREKILAHGLSLTRRTDMVYFSSFYFREPGGILFELASDKPGFTVDETVEELGSHLKLPSRFEYMRDKLENILPPLR